MNEVQTTEQVICSNCQKPVDSTGVRNVEDEVYLCSCCKGYCCHKCGEEIGLLDAMEELSDVSDRPLCGYCYDEQEDDEDWWDEDDEEDYDLQ